MFSDQQGLSHDVTTNMHMMHNLLQGNFENFTTLKTKLKDRYKKEITKEIMMKQK